MKMRKTLTRRAVLRATAAVAATPFVRRAAAAAVVPKGKMVLAWHTNIAARWLAEDAKSATFWLRQGLKFHDGSPVTPDDVKWSYEHYRGAWGDVLHERTQGVEIVDDQTVRFHFTEPFLDFPILLGTSNVSGAGWVVPAKYYET